MASRNIFGYENEDRISDLPRKIVDHIFDRMPICDVARTSVLSRKWRYIWASCPRLVFDEDFFKEIILKHKKISAYEFLKPISISLLLHRGPILKFCLHIPNIPDNLRADIGQWMSFLSRNGIMELELENTNPTPYILPSCMFYCSSLTKLNLKNCIPKLPRAFGGFQHLRTMKFVLDMEVRNVDLAIGMMNFLKDMLEVTRLELNGFSLKYLGAPVPPAAHAPAPALVKLTHVTLIDFVVDDLDQISSVFCLLKSCPNLTVLDLDVATSTDNVPEELVTGYLKSFDCMNFSLDMLQTVKIRFVKGLKSELVFIKLLLARSTCLRKMIIEYRTEIDASDEFKISRDLLQYPRACASAEIIQVVSVAGK